MGSAIRANQEIHQAWGDLLQSVAPSYQQSGVHVTLARDFVGVGVGSERYLQKEVVGLHFEVAAAAPSHADVASQIAKLSELRDKGALTEKEFQEAKQKVLAKM